MCQSKDTEDVTILKPDPAMKGKKVVKRRGVQLLDHAINLFVITPCVVIAWRSCWNRMDHDPAVYPAANSFVFGMCLHCGFALIRPRLEKRKARKSRSVLSVGVQRLLSRLYAYAFLWSNIFHWRGGWLLYDCAFEAIVRAWSIPSEAVHGLATLGILCLMAALKSVRNTIASPYCVVMDRTNDTFIFPTRFKVKSTRETVLYVLDCVFSVFVVGSLVLFVWRGCWVLMDIYIYPSNPVWSAFGSLIVGYGMAVLTFGGQGPMRWLCSRLHGVWRVAAADVFLAFSFVATVNVWRGIWQLMDLYFLAGNRTASDWISHAVSLLLLVTLNCSNSVLVRGVYIDAEEQAGECVVFPCHYLRLIVHQQRCDKRKRRVALAAAESYYDQVDASKMAADDINPKMATEKSSDQPPAVHWKSNEVGLPLDQGGKNDKTDDKIILTITKQK